MGDSKREQASILGGAVAVYGCPPFAPEAPRPPPFIVNPALTPCVTCRRHVVDGTECPFCYADARASAAEASADAELLDALDRWIKLHPAETWHGKLIRRAATRLRKASAPDPNLDPSEFEAHAHRPGAGR